MPDTAPTPARDRDLDDLLDRLHDEMDLERTESAAVGTQLTDARDLERPQGDTVVVETDGGIHFDPTFAGFPARFVGYVVDTLVVGIAVLPGLLLMASGSLALILLGLIVATLGFCAVTAWAARSIASTGRWIGNRVTSTSIVDTRTGRNLTTSAAAGRMVIRHLVSPILLVGFLPAFADPQRRTLHDRVATSVVVTRSREVWTAGGGGSGPNGPDA